ncbi:MAG: GAF domain-containing protein [Deinococcales bacterium]|nr:GAF domain-containing protein [Deinococcales bacterium]
MRSKPNYVVLAAGAYLLVSALWVAFSDRMVLAVARDLEHLASLQTLKGWFFVSLSTALVGGLAWRQVGIERRFQARVRHELEASEAQLRAATEFTDAVIDSLPGVFYVTDPQGRLVRWNRNFSAELGYPEEAMAGMSPFDLFAPEDRERVREAVARALREGAARAEVAFVTADGRRVPYSLTGTRVDTANGPVLAGMGLDVSEQHDANVRIEQLNHELNHRLGHISALREIDSAIVASLDLSAVLDTVLRQLRERLGVDAGCVLLYDPGLERLRFGASLGLPGAAHRRTSLRLGEGLPGRAALERRPVAVNDREAIAAGLPPSRGLSDVGFGAYVAMPLIAKGQLLGVLELFQHVRVEHGADWHDVLSALASQAALALENANLVESLQRSNAEMLAAYERTIEGWSRALDLRDEETEGHSRRVTEQTVRLAERLGIPRDQLVHVRRGALLHDIGKMGVPDEVLLKPGPLTDAEWALMKRHPEFAYQLLLPIEFLRPALAIPYCHHERWDGSGYPRGLKGEEIPLPARAFAVVDVYDALTSDRPYRPAWTRERALAYIRDNAGSQFDPRVVEEFLRMMAEESREAEAVQMG